LLIHAITVTASLAWFFCLSKPSENFLDLLTVNRNLGYILAGELVSAATQNDFRVAAPARTNFNNPRYNSLNCGYL
jgi:hypothetical protein